MVDRKICVHFFGEVEKLNGSMEPLDLKCIAE